MDLLWSLVVMLSLISFGQSVDKFCDKFKSNGNQMSFPYRHMSTTDTYQNYIFIGNDFWRLNFKDDPLDPSVTIDDQNSGLSNTIDGQYSQAFCVWSTSGQCITGLFKNNDIKWVEVDESLNVKSNWSTQTHINFPSKFEPNLGWVSSYRNTEDRSVIFMDTKKRKVCITYISDPKDEKEKLPASAECKDNVNGLDKHFLTYTTLNTSINVIGIIAQNSPLDQSSYLNHHTVIVMSQSGSVINYCFNGLQSVTADKRCKPDIMKVLINCTFDVIPTTTTTVGPESSNMMMYLVLLVIAAIIIIIGIVFVICFYSKKDGNQTVKSKVDSDSSARGSALQPSVERSALVSKQNTTKSSVNPAVSPSKTS